MRSDDDVPLFEVTTPTASAAARRLTTKEKVKAALRITAATDDTLIDSLIDTVSGHCARYARLARGISGVVPSFGQEVVKATWLAMGYQYHYRDRGTKLLLPWRTPISAVGSVVESDVTLVVNVDYRLIGGGMLERMFGDTPICWALGKIVAPYTAGWSLPTDVPAELEGAVIEQVKLKYLSTDRDPAIVSENVYDIARVDYAAPDSAGVGDSGLLESLEEALSPFMSEMV